MSGYDPPYPVYTDPNFPAPAPAYDQAPYDPYGGRGAVVDHQGLAPGTAGYSNPQQYSSHASHDGHHAHAPQDPFNTPPAHAHSTQQPWAHAVPHHQQDLGDYQHPLGPPHSHSFDSSVHDPFGASTSQPHLAPGGAGTHHDPTDDEPDSAPLLHHDRWSTQHHQQQQQQQFPGSGSTSGPFPGQADPSIGLPAGGFDPTLLGTQYPQGGYSDDQPIPVQYGSIPQRQPRRYKTVKREPVSPLLVSFRGDSTSRS